MINFEVGPRSVVGIRYPTQRFMVELCKSMLTFLKVSMSIGSVVSVAISALQMYNQVAISAQALSLY